MVKHGLKFGNRYIRKFFIEKNKVKLLLKFVIVQYKSTLLLLFSKLKNVLKSILQGLNIIEITKICGHVVRRELMV